MILVTGGTGLVGSHLLLHLTRSGKEVKAIYRKKGSPEKVRKVFSYYTEDSDILFDKILWINAELLDIPSLEAAFEGVTRVYHCAAYISFDPRRLERLYQSNTVGTQNIVDLCIANGIKKLCYASSVATLGPETHNGLVTEESTFDINTKNPYALTKHLAEMEVWRGTQEGVPAVIVNPGIIIGPGFWGRGSGTLFSWVAKRPKYYPPGVTGFVTVNDVVRAMIELMESDLKNERYILVDKNLGFREVLSKIAIGIGVPPPSRPMKFWFLKLMRPIDWLWSRITGSTQRIPPGYLESLRQRKIFSNSKVIKALDFEFEPMEDTIEFCSKLFRGSNP